MSSSICLVDRCADCRHTKNVINKPSVISLVFKQISKRLLRRKTVTHPRKAITHQLNSNPMQICSPFNRFPLIQSNGMNFVGASKRRIAYRNDAGVFMECEQFQQFHSFALTAKDILSTVFVTTIQKSIFSRTGVKLCNMVNTQFTIIKMLHL